MRRALMILALGGSMACDAPSSPEDSDTFTRGVPDPSLQLPPTCTEDNCWTSDATSSVWVDARLLARHGSDATLVVGEFEGDMSFGDFTITEDFNQGPHAFVASVGDDGTVRSLLNVGPALFYDIEATPDGEVIAFIDGLYDRVLDADNTQFIRNVLLRFDPVTGEIAWFHELSDFNLALARDTGGTLWGLSVGDLSADGVVVASGGGMGRFSISPTGELGSFEPLCTNTISSLTPTSDGGMVLTGYGTNDTVVGDASLQVQGEGNASYVARLDAAGHTLWTQALQFEGAGFNWDIYAAHMSGEGRVTVRTNMRGNPGVMLVLPDGTRWPAQGQNQHVVLHFGADGSYVGAVQVLDGFTGSGLGFVEGPGGMLYTGGAQSFQILHPDGAVYAREDVANGISAIEALPDHGVLTALGRGNASTRTLRGIWPPR